MSLQLFSNEGLFSSNNDKKTIDVIGWKYYVPTRFTIEMNQNRISHIALWMINSLCVDNKKLLDAYVAKLKPFFPQLKTDFEERCHSEFSPYYVHVNSNKTPNVGYKDDNAFIIFDFGDLIVKEEGYVYGIYMEGNGSYYFCLVGHNEWKSLSSESKAANIRANGFVAPDRRMFIKKYAL